MFFLFGGGGGVVLNSKTLTKTNGKTKLNEAIFTRGSVI